MTKSATWRARAMRLLILAAAACLMTAIAAGSASAENTHRFLRYVTLPVGGASPLGVDPSGNLIVWSDETNEIYKFSQSGTPVNFTGLGTNVLDGKGGFNCPSVQSDCDRLPFTGKGFGEPPGIPRDFLRADMNQSTEGPTAGWIYVEAIEEESGERRGHVVAFDAAGNYKGEIDESKVVPFEPGGPLSNVNGDAVASVVNVSPGGTVYIYQEGFPVRDIEKFQPIDENPAHNVYIGQLRKTNGPGLIYGGIGRFQADDEYVYVGHGSQNPIWEKYDGNGFTLPAGNAYPINFSSNRCECAAAGPWEDGGIDEESYNQPAESLAIDPQTHSAVLYNAYTGYIEEWNKDNERVSQQFGGPSILNPLSDATSYMRQLAIDTTGTATNGRIYVQSSRYKLAVFGPPVPAPDVLGLQVTPTHTGGHVTATVDLNHGPKATNCRVQWANDPGPEEPIFYFESKPCEPEAPYTVEQTPISVDLTTLSTETPYRVRVQVKSLNGVTKSQSVTLRPPAVLSTETTPATEVTRTTAQLNGSLDADGMPTEYFFQYGIDTQYRNKTGAASAGEGTSPAAVPPVEITNLQAGRRYHYRIVATNGLGTTYGEDQTFTAASAPIISGLRATDVAETSAVIHARINPGGNDTKYQFEYGTTPEYGQSIPAEPTSIGSGIDSVDVSAGLSDLRPGFTYHFRVVATNKWGDATSEDSTMDYFPPSCPNEYVRQLTRSAYLPDCRAYELVSPANAGAVTLLPGSTMKDTPLLQSNFIPHLRPGTMNPGTALSPARFSFLGQGGAVNGTNPPNSLIDYYTSTRTNSGWDTRHWGLKGNQTAFSGGQQCSLNGNVCIDYRIREVFGFDPNDTGSLAPFVWTPQGKSLGRWPTNFNVVKNAEEYIGADKPSPDFSHYVFSSRNIAFVQGGLTEAPGSVYDNDVSQATVDIISKDPGGDDIGQDTGTKTETIQIPAISNNGSHILMTTEGGFFGTHMYMHVGGAGGVTYDIGHGKLGTFIGMADDGSRVFFQSREQVLPDDTDFFATDIFEWNEETDEITRITQGNGQGNGEECEQEGAFRCSAIVLTTERPDLDDQVSDESGDIYFFSPEQLDPENPGVFNEHNLYVYHHGAVKYVATFDPGTKVDRLQISPDGEHAAILTGARLTSYDNEGWRQMYTFDPQSGVVQCVSCNSTGEPPLVRPPLAEGVFIENTPDKYLEPSANVIAANSGRFMSDDGRVAFTTSDPLVETDTNGINDVYEFVDGRPHLISSGTALRDKFEGSLLFSADYVGLEAVSRDGTDIFFSTIDTLVPGDLNGDFIKFYDARTGGGFGVPAAQLPCVAADECHGEENAGPPAAEIGTSAALGPEPRGNAGRKGQQKKKGKQKRKKHRRHKGRHTRHDGGKRK